MIGKKVLVVPLNWGLGHASRIIPIISAFKASGDHVVIGGSPCHLSLIQKEFKGIDTVEIPYLNIRLNGKRSQIFRIVLQIPAIVLYIIREHRALKKIIKEYAIDIVISDNCYGLWNSAVYSIFITHQVKIQLPRRIKFLENPINRINRWFIGRFNECWIPDIEEDGGISGNLSHGNSATPKVTYIGILSRFKDLPAASIVPHEKTTKKNLLIILSGPENQRTIFENSVIKELKKLGAEITYSVIRGLPQSSDELLPEGWHNHLSTLQMAQSILNSDYIVCRSGYSSIMDLVTLGRTAILIPTPGQAEQEYLAGYLCQKGLFLLQKQDEFDLPEGLKNLKNQQAKFEERIKNLPKTRFNFQTSCCNSPIKM